jgi:hypothetical protein
MINSINDVATGKAKLETLGPALQPFIEASLRAGASAKEVANQIAAMLGSHGYNGAELQQMVADIMNVNKETVDATVKQAQFH